VFLEVWRCNDALFAAKPWSSARLFLNPASAVRISLGSSGCGELFVLFVDRFPTEILLLRGDWSSFGAARR
jgi:hypothetical protein